jgi:hypothetical protein
MGLELDKDIFMKLGSDVRLRECALGGARPDDQTGAGACPLTSSCLSAGDLGTSAPADFEVHLQSIQ